MRAFIAIDIPEEIKKKIVEIQNRLPELEGKKTEYENLHLTLKFLGEVDEEKIFEIKERLKRMDLGSFEVEIKEAGIFSNRIIWLGIRNCNKLQEEIDNALAGIFEKEERFMGHLTIARVKNIKDKKKFLTEINKIKIIPIKFTVKEFNLKKSILKKEGPVYENIKVYNLEI